MKRSVMVFMSSYKYNIMKEQLISFETSKLAISKGFNLMTKNIYSLDGELISLPDENWENCDIYDQEYSAPTQSLLQKWLREEKSIYVEVVYNWSEEKYQHLVEIHTQPYGIDKLFSSYEECLEIGLQEALKLID